MRYAILSSVDKLYNENCIRHWISAGNKQIGLKTLMQNHSIVHFFPGERSIIKRLSIPEHYLKKEIRRGSSANSCMSQLPLTLLVNNLATLSL